MIQQVNDEMLAQAIAQPIPTVVTFSAQWCGPCKMMDPHLVTVAQHYQGHMRFFKVDIDEARQSAQRYQISSVPTVMIFENGQIKGRHSGAFAGPQQIDAFIREHVR